MNNEKLRVFNTRMVKTLHKEFRNENGTVDDQQQSCECFIFPKMESRSVCHSSMMKQFTSLGGSIRRRERDEFFHRVAFRNGFKQYLKNDIMNDETLFFHVSLY